MNKTQFTGCLSPAAFFVSVFLMKKTRKVKLIPELRFFIIDTERKKEATGEIRHGEASCFCLGADEN